MRALGEALAISLLVILAGSQTCATAQPSSKGGQQMPQMQSAPKNPFVPEDCGKLYRDGTQARLDCEDRNKKKEQRKPM